MQVYRLLEVGWVAFGGEDGLGIGGLAGGLGCGYKEKRYHLSEKESAKAKAGAARVSIQMAVG